MPNLLQRLLQRAAGIDQITTQLANMQATATTLAGQNATLQTQLAIDFRNQGAFAQFNQIQTQGLITNGYDMSAAVYAIVSDIAKQGANIPIVVSEVKDTKALEELNYLRKMPQSLNNDFRIFQLKKQALNRVDSSNPLQQLINNPCPSQGTRTLFYQTAIGYYLITGNSYMAMPTLELGRNSGLVNEMFVMPSQYTAVITRTGWPNPILGYELVVSGVMLYSGDEVIHVRTPNYNYNIAGNNLYGTSPLFAGRKTLATNINGDTFLDMSFVNGGPKVIVSREDWDGTEMSAPQIGQAKTADRREYSGAQNANKLKMMAGKINVHEVGLSPVDMDVIASQGWTFNQICNLYGVSSTMYNNKSASTESNVKEMRRDYWTRGVIPPINEIVEGINQKVVPLYEKKLGKKFFVELDTSGIPELQVDRQAQATWLAASPWITPEEKREFQGLPASNDPLMKKFYFPNNVVPLEDVSIPVEGMEAQQGINDDNNE